MYPFLIEFALPLGLEPRTFRLTAGRANQIAPQETFNILRIFCF